MDQGAQLHLKGDGSLAQVSREAVKSPFLKVSENQLEGAMADQSQHWRQTCSKQEAGQKTSEGSCSQHLCDCVISCTIPFPMQVGIISTKYYSAPESQARRSCDDFIV